MSKWRRGRTLRRSPRAGVMEEVERIRRTRPGPRWTRPLGGCLVLLALVWAVDPDYPLASRESPTLSARDGTYLLPRALGPDGVQADRRVRLAWEWQGPAVPFDVVLLDAAYDEVARVTEVRDRELVAAGCLREALQSGDDFFWYVEGNLGGRRFRCVPSPLVFAR